MIPKGCRRLADMDFPFGLRQRECHWLDMVTGYVHLTSRDAAQRAGRKSQFQEPVKDPARFEWHEVTKVAHYYLSVDALTQPMQVREESPPYGDDR